MIDPRCRPPSYTATRTFTVECPAGYAGSVTVTRQFTSELSLEHAEREALALAQRDATAQLRCEENGLQPFDFAVLRYKWTEEAGRDLDTRTALTAPARLHDVGWYRFPADPFAGEDVLPACTVNPLLGPLSGYYLAHGGDNCENGVEAILISFPKLVADFPSLPIFVIRMRAFWYSLRSTGNIGLEFETYLGGTMARSGYDFVNAGGSLVEKLEFDVNVIPAQSGDIDGQTLGTLTYNKAAKTASIQLAS